MPRESQWDYLFGDKERPKGMDDKHPELDEEWKNDPEFVIDVLRTVISEIRSFASQGELWYKRKEVDAFAVKKIGDGYQAKGGRLAMEQVVAKIDRLTKGL